MAPLVLVGAALGSAAMYLFSTDWERNRRADNEALVRRVRLKMKRYVAHPDAVEVDAADGKVILSGSIAAHEHAELLDALYVMHGVDEVVDRLSVFETADVF